MKGPVIIMDRNQINERLEECNSILGLIFADAKEYLLSQRRLTSAYIDACQELRGDGRHEECLALCHKYTARLYENSRTALPGRLAGFITSLSELRESAGYNLSGGELLDFYVRADSLARYGLEFSKKITSLFDSALPIYLKNLSAAAEDGAPRQFAYNLPVGFIRLLDTLI